MDVGIRVANMLLALDLVIGAGLDPGQDIIDIVLRAAREHADHIATHLEWSESGRSNHYLANLVGLLWAASYLPSDGQTDRWLAFASAELLQEADRQFLPDGGNYEGSTNYHRLSGELVLFGIALLVGLGKRDVARLGGAAVPAPLCDKLFRAAELTRAITRPDGGVVQIGDTDSGRVFKLTPVGRTETTAKGVEVREDALDHRTFVDGVGALFGIGSARTLDAVVIGRLAAGRTFAAPRQADVADHGDLDAAHRQDRSVAGGLPSAAPYRHCIRSIEHCVATFSFSRFRHLHLFCVRCFHLIPLRAATAGRRPARSHPRRQSRHRIRVRQRTPNRSGIAMLYAFENAA